MPGFFSLENHCDIRTLKVIQQIGIEISITTKKQIPLLNQLNTEKEHSILDTCTSRSAESIRSALNANAIFTAESRNQIDQLVAVDSRKCKILVCFSISDDVEDNGLDETECMELLNDSDLISTLVNSDSFLGYYFNPTKLEDFDDLCRLLDYTESKNVIIKYVYIGNSFLIMNNKDNMENKIIQRIEEISTKYNITFKADVSDYILRNTSYLISQITGKRMRNNIAYLYLNDGVYGSLHDCVFDEKSALTVEAINSENPDKTYQTTLFGPTCDSIDTIISNITLPDMNIGEWLCIYGSDYCPNTATTFNSFHSSSVVYLFC